MPPEAYYVEPVERALRHFVDDFRNVVARESGTPQLLESLKAPVQQLIDDMSWLEARFLEPVPGQVAAWAVYRSQEPDLCIFTMVVPPGAATQVHNHLTDGWVGLVQGGQVERHFRRFDDGTRPGYADVRQVDELPIGLGELTPIVHPDADIHQIRTTSSEASVSLHVLCNDLGTVERQSFTPETHGVTNFVSGYTNVDGASRIGRR